NAVVFDKTGTLTQGKFGVSDIVPAEGGDENDVLAPAASLEQHSEHPLAAGIVRKVQDENIQLQDIADFDSITGQGIEGKVAGKRVNVVSPGYVNDQGIAYDQKAFQHMSEEGKTVVFVLVEEGIAGMIALADIVRDTAKEAIATLKSHGVHSIMLTGDNEKVAHWVADQLDRKSTRLNSSHVSNSYAVFCLKKKKHD